MLPACRTPNAAIPPICPGKNDCHTTVGAAHTPGTRIQHHPSRRPPGHTPPPNGGFCTIRRIATACRRRVAPLMLQFPPTRRPNHHLARRATPGRLPAQPPLSGPPNGGFCTIRRIATACRRRVAPLMAQFPPFARARTTATPSSAPPTPGRERRQQRTLCPRTHQRRPAGRAHPPRRPRPTGPRPANQQGHAPLHWWHARSDAVHDGAPRPR